MKTLIGLLAWLLPMAGFCADINETNIPIATAGGTKTTDYVRVLTNASPNIADAKTRLLSIGDLLSKGGSQVWTNDGRATWLAGYDTPDFTGGTNGPPFFLVNSNGALLVGKSVTEDQGGVQDYTFPFMCVTCIDSNEIRNLNFLIKSQDSVEQAYYSQCDMVITGDKDTGNASLSMKATLTNGNSQTISIYANPSSPSDSAIYIYTNFTKTFSASGTGLVTCNGTIYKSNAVPAIPTAATLGVGGYWTGNSNGSLVTVYSLDGSTTVMKVLAP